MALGTEILLPFVLDIHRMHEAHYAVDGRIFFLSCRALGDKGMTQVAVFGDHLSFFTDMPVGMTTETSVGFKVADVVQVVFGRGPHVGKYIKGKGLQYPTYCLVDQWFLRCKNGWITDFVEVCDAVANIHVG